MDPNGTLSLQPLSISQHLLPKIALLPLPVMAEKGKGTLRNRGKGHGEPSNPEHENTQDDEHVDVVYQNPVRGCLSNIMRALC